jgi:hypothetical protein
MLEEDPAARPSLADDTRGTREVAQIFALHHV